MKPLLLGSSSSACAVCSLKRSLTLEKTLQIAHVSQRPFVCLFSVVTQRFIYWRNLAKKPNYKLQIRKRSDIEGFQSVFLIFQMCEVGGLAIVHKPT
jgi:hypothetical protein